MTIDEGRASDATGAGGEITSAATTGTAARWPCSYRGAKGQGTAEELAAIEADLGSV